MEQLTIIFVFFINIEKVYEKSSHKMCIFFAETMKKVVEYIFVFQQMCGCP